MTAGDREPSALSVRVDNLADDVHGFRIDLQSMRTTMVTKDDFAGIVSSINALSTKQETVSRPNWQAMSVAVTVLVLIGGILYWPLKETSTDAKEALRQYNNSMIDERIKVGILQNSHDNLSKRLDMISTRLAELIRTGK
jgi:hypothetical protein